MSTIDFNDIVIGYEGLTETELAILVKKYENKRYATAEDKYVLSALKRLLDKAIEVRKGKQMREGYPEEPDAEVLKDCAILPESEED